jgi:hypothetical protein
MWFRMLIMVFDTDTFVLLLATELHINVCSQNHIIYSIIVTWVHLWAWNFFISLYPSFPCTDYSYTLKTEAESSSGMLLCIYHTTWPHLPRILWKVQLPLNGRHILWLAEQNVDLTFKNSLHTSQEAHYVTITKPGWLMLFGETVAVYCENHTEHTDTLCGQNAEFVPHRKHITSPLQSPTG